MKAYLTKDGVVGQFEFNRPKPIPQPGDVYEFQITQLTAGNTYYYKGDTLELVRMTETAPHGYRCNVDGRVQNWFVKSKTGTNVWSMIECLISDKILVRK